MPEGYRQPTEDELIAFAAKMLAESGTSFTEPELLRETVREARRTWVLLYRAHHGMDEEP